VILAYVGSAGSTSEASSPFGCESDLLYKKFGGTLGDPKNLAIRLLLSVSPLGDCLFFKELYSEFSFSSGFYPCPIYPP